MDNNFLTLHGVVGGGDPTIKSIQRGSTTLSSNVELSVLISEVDLTKAVAFISTSAGGGSVYQILSKIRFIDSTHVGIKVNSLNFQVAVNWVVVEFGNVKSLQSGSVSLTTSSSFNQTVTEVDALKSKIFASYEIDNTQGTIPKWVLNSSTNIAFSKGVSSGTTNIEWYLIEFY